MNKPLYVFASDYDQALDLFEDGYGQTNIISAAHLAGAGMLKLYRGEIHTSFRTTHIVDSELQDGQEYRWGVVTATTPVGEKYFGTLYKYEDALVRAVKINGGLRELTRAIAVKDIHYPVPVKVIRNEKIDWKITELM